MKTREDIFKIKEGINLEYIYEKHKDRIEDVYEQLIKRPSTEIYIDEDEDLCELLDYFNSLGFNTKENTVYDFYTFHKLEVSL